MSVAILLANEGTDITLGGKSGELQFMKDKQDRIMYTWVHKVKVVANQWDQ